MNQQDQKSLQSSTKLGAKVLELAVKNDPFEGKKASVSPTQKVPQKGSKMIFALFLLANLFINYDGGVVPASLVQIENELHITYTEEAALGNILYGRINL